jgi:hypothetical protein
LLVACCLLRSSFRSFALSSFRPPSTFPPFHLSLLRPRPFSLPSSVFTNLQTAVRRRLCQNHVRSLKTSS